MNQILDFIRHLSVQDICGIIGAITSIIVLIPQRKGVNNDAYVIVHPNSVNPQSDTLGCTIRTFLYILFAISMLLLLPLFISTPINMPSSILASASPSPITPSFTEGARLTIQMFYNDINKRDYQAAYYLTKDGFGQSYQNFASSFIYTKYDTISFNNVKELPNYIIQVTITIQAIENCPTGERTNSYYTIYTVVPDHGGFTIISGRPIKSSTYLSYCA